MLEKIIQELILTTIILIVLVILTYIFLIKNLNEDTAKNYLAALTVTISVCITSLIMLIYFHITNDPISIKIMEICVLVCYLTIFGLTIASLIKYH